MSDKKLVGGRRSYQPGRPPKEPGEKHQRIGFSVPPDVYEWLMALDRRSEWLTEAVRRERKDQNRDG